jgi:hypothetical protein
MKDIRSYIFQQASVMKFVIVILVLGFPSFCLGYLSADLNRDGTVDFHDFAILADQWLKVENQNNLVDLNRDRTVNFYDFAILANQWLTVEDQNNIAGNPKFEFGPNSPQLSFARDSIAYDNDLKEYPVNIKRVESVALSSRPEVIINRQSSRIVYAVDGNQVLCGWDTSLYSTADGQSFTRILNIQSNTTLDSGGTFADYTVSDEIVEGLMIMADGSWLLSTGRGLPGIRGHLFRSINKGVSWSVCKWAADGKDFQLAMGFVPEWASIGIANNEVVIGEYGYRSQYDNPRRIYYSDNFGATWTMIIDIGPAGWQPDWGYIKGQHCHAVTFGVGDTSIVYASYGDRPFMCVKKFKCFGNRKNPADWKEVKLPWEQFVYMTAPVCLFNDGSHIYVGHDGGICPALWRFDADENREDVISVPTRPSNWTESMPYRLPNSEASYMFGMAKHNGVFYAAVGAHPYQMIMAGIYVSTDGRHWVCARRFPGEVGPYTVVGYANGYIWGTYKDTNSKRYLFKFTPVNACVVPALRVERGMTNIANSPNRSCFDMAVEDWAFSGNIDSVVWTDAEHLLGNGCVKVASKDGAGDTGCVLTKRFSEMGGLPSPGDYICFSAWVKAASSWPPQASFFVSFENTTNLDYGGCSVVLNEDWQRVITWSKCIGAPHWSLRGKFWSSANGYTGSFSDLQYYIDVLQVVYFPDLHYSGSWQKGGTARADEFAFFPLMGLPKRFSLAFNWRPDCGSDEWHADFLIATIIAIDGSYLELFWDQSEKEFFITDGINREILDSGGQGVWEPPDIVKFAIVCDGHQTNLYVENSVNGVTSVTGSNGCTLTDLPASILLASNSDRSILGCGLFSSIKAWDSELSAVDVNEVFNNP